MYGTKPLAGKETVEKVKKTAIVPKGFKNEAALVDHIADSCQGKRTLMLTGNYVVGEGEDMLPDDPRLLGEKMLLTIELCLRVRERCIERGIMPPTLLLCPNDIAPGVFNDAEERRAFRVGYSIPEEIAELLKGRLSEPLEPVYMFSRDPGATTVEIESRQMELRRHIHDNHPPLVVLLEGNAQNWASRWLKKTDSNPRLSETREGLKTLVSATITDSYSGEPSSPSSQLVRVTHPNGAPFCSFIAATLFERFETLGFENMVNTFVSEEYPCVDKAAAAYRDIYGGTMTIRNIYLDESQVVADNTIS
ncbi:MAG: hypothetical protein V1827_00650 [Candidatus Micrarchaeota archaeon]